MSNRAARRKAAKHSSPSLSSAASIPLAQPTRGAPEGKTLIDLAAERQASLSSGTPFSSLSADSVEEIQWKDLDTGRSGEREPPTRDEDIDEPIGPFGQAVFYTVSLVMLHFTLDVLAHNQYRQDVDWMLISQNTATAFLPILAIVYLLHSQAEQLYAQVLFFVLSTAAGAYLIYAANEEGYYAVMKRAPPLGTLWVWSVIELKLSWALGSLAICTGWLWWGGWSLI